MEVKEVSEFLLKLNVVVHEFITNFLRSLDSSVFFREWIFDAYGK